MTTTAQVYANMVGSTDSLNFSSEIIPSDGRNSIPLKCWQDVPLSNIWIPSHLLTSRNKPSSVTRGIFHTLEKRDSAKCIESFSTYTDEEIFVSDSDGDDYILNYKGTENYKDVLLENESAANTDLILNCTSTNYDKSDITDKISHQYKNKENEYLNVKEIISSIKTMPSVDNLCNTKSEETSDVNYSYKTSTMQPQQCEETTLKQNKQMDSRICDSNFLNNQEKKLDMNKKKNKKKKKAIKKINLEDYFLDDYNVEDLQTSACNNYFQKLLQEKNKLDGIQIRSEKEFPNLQEKSLTFIHAEKKIKNSEPNLKNATQIISSNENENNINFEENATSVLEPERICGKLIIEDIPKEVNKDDIYQFLLGYGEIKSFHLETIGEFLKVYIEIDSICDIDWITECLNGSEPFGDSTNVIKCYKQE